MLGKLFKKKGKGTPGLAAPARTLEQSDDLIDQDETIVIDLTSDAHLKPEDIRLHLDDVQPAVDAPAEPTVFRPQGPAESLGPAEHEDTQIWTGQSFQPAPARESPEVRQAAKPARPENRPAQRGKPTAG